jgi:hypothetical protein
MPLPETAESTLCTHFFPIIWVEKVNEKGKERKKEASPRI